MNRCIIYTNKNDATKILLSFSFIHIFFKQYSRKYKIYFEKYLKKLIKKIVIFDVLLIGVNDWL